LNPERLDALPSYSPFPANGHPPSIPASVESSAIDARGTSKAFEISNVLKVVMALANLFVDVYFDRGKST
jgi:hypothetical protein